MKAYTDEEWAEVLSKSFIIRGFGKGPKVCLPKEEFARRSREELQESLKQLIEAGVIPSSYTVDDIGVWQPEPMKFIAYMTSDVLEGLLEYVKEGNLVGLGMALKALTKVVDNETIDCIQRLVEKEEKKDAVEEG